ncbi:MAG: GNAT family N-acetyltransferase [Oscillospiraceae bacterium]|nr:GNAT family N-acetyltransferase [Oscillospiraceae bacterium]
MEINNNILKHYLKVAQNMNYEIMKLEPQNFHKLDNIWDMSKHKEMSEIWHKQLISGNRIIFVYCENGEYLGQGDLVCDMNDPDYTIANKRIYLSRMVVKNEYRNRGIGKIILDYLIYYARNLGYTEISLGVDIDNIGARWLCEKNGFTNIIYTGEDSDGKYVKLLKVL